MSGQHTRTSKINRFAVRCFFKAVLITSPLLFAADVFSATDIPIQLDADHAELDNAKGVSIYTGNVIMTQGTLKITGDKITVFTTPDHKVKQIFVDGEKATYDDQPEKQKEPVHAEAIRIEYYYQPEEYILLLDQALLEQGRNTFTGDRIKYLVNKEIVKAQSKTPEDSRVRVTLFPDDNNDSRIPSQ